MRESAFTKEDQADKYKSKIFILIQSHSDLVD